MFLMAEMTLQLAVDILNLVPLEQGLLSNVCCYWRCHQILDFPPPVHVSKMALMVALWKTTGVA